MTDRYESRASVGSDVEAVLRLFLTEDGYIAECDIPHIVAALTTPPADQAGLKRRPYNPSGSLSEYGIFPECDAQPLAEEGERDWLADAMDEMTEWRMDALEANGEVDMTTDKPTEGEEVMVKTPNDVMFILPLQPSGRSIGPRFVVHVPLIEAPAVKALQAKIERLEKILGAYQAAVNKIDDLIEYSLPMPPETKASLYAVLANLTATLAKEITND